MYRRYKIILYALLLCPILAFAQKEELKKRCKAMDDAFNGVNPLHVQYVMTIVGNADVPGKESLTFDLYKAGDRSKAKMGEAQDVVQKGKLMVTVNHIDKLVSVNPDTKDIPGEESLMGTFSMLVDSASKVVKKSDQNYTTYTLYFSEDYIYSMLRFSFTAQSQTPVSFYAEFGAAYTEPYYSMEINYKKWDQKWKPEIGFPHIENFVMKKGDRYEAQAAYRGYEFFQLEKGKF
jgi:hypothetical protein